MSYEVVRLGDVCKVTGGFAFKSTDYLEEGIPLIRIGNIGNEKIDIKENAVCVDKKFLSKCQNFIVNKGDILVALSGATTGKFGIYNLDDISLLNQRVGRIVPNLEKLDNKFILFILYVLKDKILSSAGGAAQPNISPKEIENFQIPLPPLDIQKKIADALDKAQELIDKRKEQISALDKFLENLFLDMFGDPVSNPMGWEEEKILNCINKVENIKIKNNENLEIRYIDISSIDNSKNKVIGFQEYELISAPSRAKQKVFRNDILISLVRPNLKNIAILNFTYENMIASTGFCILRSSIKINPTYLFSLVKQDKFNDKLVNLTSGATYPAIKVSDVLEQIISLPPLDLQNQFAFIVEKVEAEKTKLEASLKEMEDNFNSIMQRAFKGELF